MAWLVAVAMTRSRKGHPFKYELLSMLLNFGVLVGTGRKTPNRPMPLFMIDKPCTPAVLATSKVTVPTVKVRFFQNAAGLSCIHS